MKNLKIEELVKYDVPALTSIIDYWEDYENETIFLAIAELKRRGYNHTKKIEEKLNQFCIKNNIMSLDETLKIYFNETGANSYEEYYNKKFIALNKSNKKKYIIAAPQNISSAGESLKTIFYCSLVIIANFILGFYLISNSNDTETLKVIYIFIGIISLVFNILMLVNLYIAGDNLVKACKEIVSE